MKFTKESLENKRDSKDLDVAREIPQDIIKALHQLNLLDSLIEQEVSFFIPSYIKKADSFLDDLLAKAHLIRQHCEYRVCVKKHTNSVGTYYNGVIVMPFYQMTNLPRNAEYVGRFVMK